jgi:hypothetical protein
MDHQARWASRYAPVRSTRTGLMSTTGVPPMASIGHIRSRVPEILRRVTRWSPNGFGRCEDRMLTMKPGRDNDAVAGRNSR